MSYDSTLPTERDKVRTLIGDTDPSNEVLDDDHIDDVLAQQGTTARAAAWCAQEVKAILLQDPMKVKLSDGTSVDYQDRLSALDAVIQSGAPAGIATLTRPPATARIGIMTAGTGYIVR